MENSFRYYKNEACMYFPCHDVKDTSIFNCMFCYCPLYFLEACGGNFKMAMGVKDCSNCFIPHSKNGYDYINEKIREHNDKRMAEEIEKLTKGI